MPNVAGRFSTNVVLMDVKMSSESNTRPFFFMARSTTCLTSSIYRPIAFSRDLNFPLVKKIWGSGLGGRFLVGLSLEVHKSSNLALRSSERDAQGSVVKNSFN